MDADERSLLLTVEKTTHQCPIGEIVGNKIVRKYSPRTWNPHL